MGTSFISGAPTEFPPCVNRSDFKTSCSNSKSSLQPSIQLICVFCLFYFFACRSFLVLVCLMFWTLCAFGCWPLHFVCTHLTLPQFTDGSAQSIWHHLDSLKQIKNEKQRNNELDRLYKYDTFTFSCLYLPQSIFLGISWFFCFCQLLYRYYPILLCVRIISIRFWGYTWIWIWSELLRKCDGKWHSLRLTFIFFKAFSPDTAGSVPAWLESPRLEWPWRYGYGRSEGWPWGARVEAEVTFNSKYTRPHIVSTHWLPKNHI